MQWFSLVTEKIFDYEHKITIIGQDLQGMFTMNGFFVNTVKGTTVWF